MSFPEFANNGKRGTCVIRLIQGKAMGTMKESYEQMEMKRLAAQRKKEKAQAIKDKERVRQQVRKVGCVFSMVIWSESRTGQYSDDTRRENAPHFTGFMSDNVIPLEHPCHDIHARHFLLFAPYIVSLWGSHIGVSCVTPYFIDTDGTRVIDPLVASH